ncbi:MAG: hypothetical protein H6702_14730 [Myxococcales bacterium]|nr:hypothetical protein [Myxococcales bacterium]
MSTHPDERSPEQQSAPLTPEDAVFLERLRTDFQPPPLGPGAAQAFDARLAARRAAQSRRGRWAWGVGLPVALAAAAAVVMSLRVAPPPAVDAPRALPSVAAASPAEPDEAPVLALLTDTELTDDELYPDDYLALADALAWD